MPLAKDHGFTLVETLLALFIVAAALAAMAQVAALSARANAQARSITMATVLAGRKMEQLWAESAHLETSAADALRHNAEGLHDFFDARGRELGHGAVAPAGTAYVRRWSIAVIARASGSIVVLQVVVWPEGRGVLGLGTGRDDARLHGGAHVTSVKALGVD